MIEIIYDSGKEKESQMFILLHKFWEQIKSKHLKASKIFNMLQKTSVIVVESENIRTRDLYYNLNKNRELS